MKRRSNVVKGCVNFPIYDPQYKNSNEGGMVVKLVAFNNADLDAPDSFEVCCGSVVQDMLSETFIGHDKASMPTWGDEDWIHYEMRRIKFMETVFPHINDNENIIHQYSMKPALCSIVLGNTGWSGWNEIDNVYWKCSYDDLTDEGKMLYDSLHALYGEHVEIFLLTFLDT